MQPAQPAASPSMVNGDTAILAIDQGTTSTRAMVFDRAGHAIARAQQEFPQHYPANGWVEHDPADIWQTSLATARSALGQADQQGKRIVALGMTNQRETTLVWDKDTGEPIHNAIVWQDRRTADRCEALRADGAAPMVAEKTGLVLDPYFSASKIGWILDRVDGARAKAIAGRLAFGTVDSYLLWRLTGGKTHATDATNASRTSLFNINAGNWDEDLLELFDVPRAMLPDVRDSADDFGVTDTDVLGAAIPICGVAGDQQAALFGQACFSPGDIKSTYGTGCFMVVNTGADLVRSNNQLLTTIAYRLGGKTTYALEGSIFVAGAGVQWLRDELRLIQSAGETEALAAGLASNGGVYVVPAFTGLGAPHWRADVRGAVFGLTRDAGPAVLARAMVEAVGYQTHDLLTAMARDGVRPTGLRVDGGMVANDWLCGFLADILALPVARPIVTETTALGAAFLAGLHAGVYASLDDIAASWRAERQFTPSMTNQERDRLMTGWHRAVRAACAFATGDGDSA